MRGKNPEPEPAVLTAKEVAAYLHVKRATVYRLLKTGQLPGFRLGSDWRFRVEDINRWLMRAEEQRTDGKKG